MGGGLPVSDLTPIRKSAVTGQALERIKEMILSGRFPAGSKLPPERELSSALRISRSSVREAIRALSHMNILEARHGQGTFVTSLSPELLIEPLRFVLSIDDELIFKVFETRKILEVGAAALAAPRIDEDELEELRTRYTALIESIDDLPRFLAEDFAMHEIIIRTARNELLTSLYASISSLLRESRMRTVRLPGVPAQTVIDHGEILRALEVRDTDACAEAMRRHLERVEGKLRGAGSDFLDGMRPARSKS